jgi:hypothetical protein
MFNVEVAFRIDQLNGSGDRGIDRHNDDRIVMIGRSAGSAVQCVVARNIALQDTKSLTRLQKRRTLSSLTVLVKAVIVC